MFLSSLFLFFFISKQTRSFHLGHRLESSMKAGASLWPGTWRAYRAVAPSTKSLYPMVWTMTLTSMTSTRIMAQSLATRHTCSAPQRAAPWTSTTDTHREVPSTPTACHPSWWHHPLDPITFPAVPFLECTTAHRTMIQPHGTTAPPSQPPPPPRLSLLPQPQPPPPPPPTTPATRATAFPPIF